MKVIKYLFLNILMIIAFSGCFSDHSNENIPLTKTPIDYVNPYIGNISHLLVPTFPTIHLPNSMLRVMPNRSDYTSEKLIGLPIVTTAHRGKSTFTINPIKGKKGNLKSIYNYSYDHEVVTPYSYEVYFDEEQIQVSYGLSHRSAIYTFDFGVSKDKYVILTNKKGHFSIDDNTVSGYMDITGNSDIVTNVYLYLECENPLDSAGILKNGKISNIMHESGTDVCVALKFNKDSKIVKIKYGISFISVEQAKDNLNKEIQSFNQEKLIEDGKKIWNKALSKTLVEGGSENDKVIFYTSIYRTYERPICISENGKYFSGFDGKVHEDNGDPFYTDDWIWDTYRAAHPLRILTEKEMESSIIRSFIKMADQMDEFWMPTFPAINGDGRKMNSNHGVATILDAYTKGITDFDLDKAYKACKGAITEKTLVPWSGMKAGELDDFYQQNGYIPALKEGEIETIPEVSGWEKRQPVAVTLGTVYDEWCLSQIAKIIGNERDYSYFLKRSYNYRKLFNHQTGFFHPKDDEGNFIEPFDYRYSAGPGARLYYGENNAWIYRWDVPHNIGDLIVLMGGKETFINNLETTFNEPLGKSKFKFYSQLPDHTGNVGQFSMANEPSLHIPYLYNYAGQPWKTQKLIKKLITEWFRNDLMGVPGDEDGGGMSAFVAFSMMGFYPVTPGSSSYNIGSPFFEKTTIDLGNGNTFVIIAKNLSAKNKYIQKAKLNGKNWNKPWFKHHDIENGGELELEMGPYANYLWGNSSVDVPPSEGNIVE